MNNTPLLEETLELVLSPHKSGVYLSKPDIGRLAVFIGFTVILQERKKMLEQLFKYLRSQEELIATYDALIVFYEAKKSDYESLFGFFTSAKMALDGNYEKCNLAIAKLQEFKEEAELLEFIKPEDI